MRSSSSLGAFIAGFVLVCGPIGCEKREKDPPVQAPAAAAPSPPPVQPPPPEPPKAAPTARFHDTDFGFTTSIPEGWRAAPNNSVTVPGTVLKVWALGGVASVVAFVQDPGQAVTARQVLDSSSAAMKKAGCSVSQEQVVKVSGKDAMSLKLSGPGTGAALGGGAVQTYQHWIAIPRGNRVLVLLLTCPQATKTQPATAFEGMVAGLKID